nr:hypothetical protein [Tanacetum cinerariifolium]
TDHPIFLNDNEDHPIQNKESPENSSEENVVSKANQEPPQDSDIHQLIEKCSVEVPEEQKLNMEKTMFDLVKISEDFKIYSNPLYDEDEIDSDKLDPHCFNVESDFVESLLNRDTFIDFSSKFYFSGDLAHIKPEIPKFDFDFKEEIRLIENLLYDNSFPQPPDNNFDLEPEVISAVMEDIDEPDEHFNPGGEIFVSTKIKDDYYFPFMFVIRIFLPYLILPEISPLLLSAESEDTIFDPGISE